MRNGMKQPKTILLQYKTKKIDWSSDDAQERFRYNQRIKFLIAENNYILSMK